MWRGGRQAEEILNRVQNEGRAKAPMSDSDERRKGRDDGKEVAVRGDV